MNLPPSLRIAIGFLTRIPVAQAEHAESSFGRSLAWFPIVGAVLGALLLGAQRLFQPWLAPSLQAVLLVVLWALATGGLHLDGLADVFDGWSGGRGDRDRTLAIMRDSHIGAHGAAALALFLIAKVAVVLELVRAQHPQLRVLLLCPVLARWLVVGLVLAFPYAREQGLGSVFRRHAQLRDWLWGSMSLAAALAWAGWSSILPAIASALTVAVLGYLANRRLGGLTGDLYGACIELAELVFLLGCSVG